jgi:hypothetical protein
MESARKGGDPLSLAFVLGEIGRVDQAEQVIIPLRESPPNTPEYWMLEGHIALWKREGRFAEQYYDRAVKAGVDSSVAEPYLQQARVLSRLNVAPRESVGR